MTMLIYGTHNFSENYLSAIGVSDDFMKSEILIDEIGKLIIENKRDVVDLLRKNSVNASINDNNQKLAYIFAKYIGSDKKIRLEVVDMIKNKSIDQDKFTNFIGTEVYHNATGKGNEKNTKRFAERNQKFEENIKAAISDKDQKGSFTKSIEETLEKTFTDKKNEKERSSPLETNARILQERVKMNEMNMHADGSTGPNVKKIVLWSLGIAAIASVAIYIGYRVYMKKKMSSDVPPGPETPPATPPAPPAPPTQTV